MKLQLDVERMLEEERSDFEVSKTIKEEIKNYLVSLSHVFERDQGKHFLVKHTKNIDHIISNVYRYILRKQFQEYLPLINTIPITIIAMGSYGREQLSVYSDIDLLILYKDLSGYNLQEIIESFLKVLWDSGLKLGHRVHEIETIGEAAQSDHTIKTALLESRFIYGSKYLWTEYEHQLKIIRLHNPKAFIEAKIAEREAARKKHPFSMQSDIKNAPGGLRDANLLLWIAKVLYNVNKIRELPSRLISESEYKELRSAIEFLYRVRSALHLSAGRKNDRLILELIPSVATLLGLSQTKTVQRTFEAMHHINILSSIVTKRLIHTLFVHKENIPVLRASRVNENHYRCHHTHYGSLYEKQKPLQELLESMLLFADEKNSFDISFISMLKYAKRTHLPDTKRLPLIKAFFYREKSAALFKALYDAGHLFTLIQPLRKVAYLPQFDGYHTHPVDLHSIDTLKALEEIKDPFVKTRYDNLSEEQKAILRLSAFLHDSGKGRKSDHSKLGAAMIKKYALKLGFDAAQAQIIHTLILYHTLMSNTAHREDIYSEKVTYSFTARIKTREILDMLYILTYADIASVSQTAYTANNARLLYELYQNACEALSNKTILTEASRRNKKEAQLKKLSAFTALSRVLQKKVLRIESNLFFIKHTPAQIIDIAIWASTLESEFAYRITNHDFLSISIIRKKSVNLGYILSKLGTLSVVTMDLFKLFDDIKYFHIEFDEKIPEEEMLYIEQILDDTLISDKQPRLKKIHIKPSQIKINCEHSKSYAKMQIVTEDQKGLMANIFTVFDDIGIDIASAKIQTIKKRARNLFLIEKNGLFCDNRKRVVEKLTNPDKG